MRGSRLALVVAVALAIVVAGGAATVLIAGRSQEEKTPPPVLSQEVPPKKGSADVADTATLSTASDEVLVDIKTGSAIHASSKPTPKPTACYNPTTRQDRTGVCTAGIGVQGHVPSAVHGRQPEGIHLAGGLYVV